MTTKVQRSFYPTSDSSHISWKSEDAVSEHTVKLSISVDYSLLSVPKSQDEISRKYYITYSLGSHIEGKSEILTVGEQKWLLQQEVTVNKDLLINLYRYPSEIVLWEIKTIPKEVRKKKELEEASQSKRKATGPKSSNAIQMSLANTGLIKKKPKLKTQGKFIPSQVISKTALDTADEVEADLPTDPLLLLKRSSSSPNLGSASDEWKKRPGSGSSILSRPASSSYANSILSRPASSSYAAIESYTGPSGHSRTFPHPHHFDHPEKHVDGSLIRSGLVRSRSSSLTNIMRTDRPRTPPSPHHHNHPLKTIKKENGRGGSSAKKKTSSLSQQSPSAKMTSIRWDGSASPKSSANRDQVSIENSLRLENDHQILRGNYPLLEKRKGDSLHTPIERVIFDFSGVFMDVLEIQGTIKSCRKQLSDCLFKIFLDSKLLSTEQRQKLNPMVVTLGVAEGMPDKPVPFKFLDNSSRPIYATFKFFNDPFYHTAVLNQNHDSTLNFQSKHVILAGLLDSKRLQDDIKQSKLLIEIHDRDFKYSKEAAENQSRFFEGGIIQTNLNPVSPYGQAYFDLKEICNGKRYLKLETPILPSPRVDRHLTKGSLLQGDYFSKSSIFKIEVEVQNPFPPTEVLHDLSRISTMTISCRNNVSCIRKILDFICNYNIASLRLEGKDDLQKESLLCSHVIPKDNENADILHGYHIYDVDNHLMFIEGHYPGGLSCLETFLIPMKRECDFSRNESMFYRQKPLTSPSLMHFQLEPTISKICTWTKSAVIVSTSLGSINYFNQIIISKKEDWKINAFPFPAQKVILPLLKGYATVKTGAEIRSVLNKKAKEIIAEIKETMVNSGLNRSPVGEESVKQTGKRVAVHKIDSANARHNNLLKLRKNREPNFISINSKRSFSYSPSFDASTDINVFNYSIQKHSSTQNQIKDLRSKLLQQSKTKILAFAGDFLSSIPSKPSDKGVKGIVNSILHGSSGMSGNYNDTYSKLLSRGKSVHELSIHNIKPEAMDDYKGIIKSAYSKISSDPKIPTILFGSFTTEVGELDQAVHIWEYNNYEGYEDAIDSLRKNEEYKKMLTKIKPMLRSRQSQIVLEFAFWNASIPYDANSIYELRSYLLKPGRMLEWEQGWQKGLEARKQFVEPVGAWFSQLGELNYVHHMWAYPSLLKRKEMRERTWKVKGWGESVQQTVGLIDHMQSRILEPLLLNTKGARAVPADSDCPQ